MLREAARVSRLPRRLVSVGIVLFWLGAMSWLVYNEIIVPRLYKGEFVHRFQKPQELWMGIFLGEKRSGYLTMRNQPAPRENERGIEMDLTARIDVAMFGANAGMFLTGKAWMSEMNGLRDFDFSMNSMGHQMRVEGAVKDKRLEAQLHTAGETLPFSFPVPEDLLLTGGMGMSALEVPLLEPGTEMYVDAFDPTAMRMGKAKIECKRRERMTVRGKEVEVNLIETTLPGLTTKAWVTDEEEVVRADTPFGFSLRAITPEEALAPIQPGEQASLVRNVAIHPEGIPPHDDLTRMKIAVSGVPEERMPPDDVWQKRDEDGVYTISQPEAPVPPVTVDAAAAGPEALASDAFVQAGHPKIVAMAATICGTETDLWKKALLINGWVYENIKREPVVSVPSALEVLSTKTGDCNENSILFVSLARAAGIPSRIAIGLAWSDSLKAFGYHAWVEVYMGRWVPMDPTFGQALADATHIKLLNGGIETWGQIIPVAGKLEIEVLEIAPAG